MVQNITKDFVQKIQTDAKKGTYRVNLGDIAVDVSPYVFPPQSPFSESTHTVYDELGDLTNKLVLDIGTGTGIQAIQAAKRGSKHVDAVDINQCAVDCAKHNVQLNCLTEKISVFKSDMFSNVPKNKYDIVVANLPIVEENEQDIRLHSLFDPGFKYHKVLFSEAENYLNKDGKIVLCHANLQSKEDFDKLEKLAAKHDFLFDVNKRENALGHEWRNYEFTKDNHDCMLNGFLNGFTLKTPKLIAAKGEASSWSTWLNMSKSYEAIDDVKFRRDIYRVFRNKESIENPEKEIEVTGLECPGKITVKRHLYSDLAVVTIERPDSNKFEYLISDSEQKIKKFRYQIGTSALFIE